MNSIRSGLGLKAKETAAGWSFVILAVILIGTFYFYPMVQAFILSLKSGPGTNLSYVGFDNYKRLFSDVTFFASVTNTFIYLLVQVPVMIVLALIFSVLLNDPKLKLRGWFRTAVFLPCVTSLVAYAVTFKFLFAGDGLVNQFLVKIGLVSAPIGWTTDPFWAKVTIIMAITWRWTGYNMVFYLSALQNIDPAIYEASRIDGASAFRRFTMITVPLLKPIILFTSITSTIGTLQLFDEVVNITSGGPGNATMTISQYIYNISFKYTPDFGYAATVSYAILFFIVFFSIFQFRAMGDRRV